MPFIRAGRFLCAAAAALVFATPASAQSANTTILIGAVVDQTGGSTSPHYRAAIELAGRQMNEALAQAGSKIKFEILFGDSKSDPPFAQQEALRLINQHGVKALVGDSSGVSVALNRLNYDPASQAKGKVAITCFQCSSSFINDPEVTESDPQVQAAERDLDGWLFRVFYVAKFEASALAQIALKRANKGDGPLKVGIFADGGHRALATDLAKALPSFHKGALSVEIVYLSARDKIAAEWPTVVDDKDAAGKTDGPPDVVIVAMLPDPAALAIKAYREAWVLDPALVQQLVPPRLPTQSAWRARQRRRGLVGDPGRQGTVWTGLRGGLLGGDRRDAGDDVVGRL
jgi:ABC-type branched-subunit amino acid transport system substrate-binding protein